MRIQDAGQKASDLFHAWANQPDFVPMDEDMCINLIGRIRDLLLKECEKAESAVRLKVIERLMDGDPKPDTVQGKLLVEIAKEQERYEKRVFKP